MYIYIYICVHAYTHTYIYAKPPPPSNYIPFHNLNQNGKVEKPSKTILKYKVFAKQL